MTWTWTDTPGDDPAAVELALPLLGIAAGLEEPFPCVLPGPHAPDRVACVSGRDLRYRCPACLGLRELRLVDVYAARRMGSPKPGQPQGPLRLASTLAVAWWGHLWTAAGVQSLDLPSVELEPDCPNRQRVETVLRGLVSLQAIYAQAGPLMPCEYSEGFAAAWCDGISEPAAWRSLKLLADRGYVSRVKVKPEKGRARWRYHLTGKGLVIERPVHSIVLPNTTALEAA